jgi:tetratricopeptide (TPR) repeat protein
MSTGTTLYFAKVITRRSVIGSLIPLVAMLLTACQGSPQRDAPPEPVEAVVEAPQEPEEILTPGQRVRKAILALQTGDNVTARKQLNLALEEIPRLGVANRLLEQMDADPVRYLGRKHTLYTVAAGDSLANIAKEQLGDALKFVILARYNNIDNPSLLQAGQPLKIPVQLKAAVPGKQPAATPPSLDEALEPATAASDSVGALADASPLTSPETGEARAPGSQAAPSVHHSMANVAMKEKGSQPNWRKAGQRHAAGDLIGAIALMEQTGDPAVQSVEFRSQLAGYYLENADKLANQGKLTAAESSVQKVASLGAIDGSTARRLAAVDNRIKALRLHQQASTLLQADKLPEAFALLSRAYALAPAERSVASAYRESKIRLTDSYHRQAMQLFRKHELDKAIAYWDEILAIDPGHNLAPGYRARAIELRSKLLKIEQ